jgi:hypothetical protein
MYIISGTTESGLKQYFTGRTKRVGGKHIALMTSKGDMKIYTTVKSVCRATKKLERKCPDQKPFYAELHSKYLKEKWSPLRL